jgi:hypothetical protein
MTLKIFAAAVLVLGGALNARAVGISVDPSYVRLTEVELKGTVRLQKPGGYLLKIHNPEGAAATYMVSLMPCKSMNMKPNGGYEELPDMSWLVFKSTEVTVAAGGTGYLPYLDIKAPKGDYKNKRWQILVKVAKQGKEFLGAETVLPIWIETKTQKRSAKHSGDKKHGK